MNFWPTLKKAEYQRINAFDLWCWRRLWKVPWTSKEIKTVNPKGNQLNIHWKDWCWSWSSNPLATWCKELTHRKKRLLLERLKAGEGGDRGWDGWMDHRLNGHDFEQSPGDTEGQRSLACYSPRSRKEEDTALWLNNNIWRNSVYRRGWEWGFAGSVLTVWLWVSYIKSWGSVSSLEGVGERGEGQGEMLPASWSYCEN